MDYQPPGVTWDSNIVLSQRVLLKGDHAWFARRQSTTLMATSIHMVVNGLHALVASTPGLGRLGPGPRLASFRRAGAGRRRTAARLPRSGTGIDLRQDCSAGGSSVSAGG